MELMQESFQFIAGAAYQVVVILTGSPRLGKSVSLAYLGARCASGRDEPCGLRCSTRDSIFPVIPPIFFPSLIIYIMTLIYDANRDCYLRQSGQACHSRHMYSSSS